MREVLLTMLLVFALINAYPRQAQAEGASIDVNRFNVVLVIDKSGSLRDINGFGTDPDGLRFDALRLFLGLLTESGNNVGTIVFDEQIRYEAPVRLKETMEEKKQLIEEVESFDTSYDTDIGGAVLRATEMLREMKKENELPCMIVLFTDGQTDFSSGNQWLQQQKSWAKGSEALKIAQEEGITISGILLNVDGRARNGGAELRVYTDGTGGTFEQITSPEDLTGAFKRFYTIINNTEYTGAEKIRFSPEGEAETTFAVPSFGVEEVNVVVEHDSTEKKDPLSETMNIAITRPDGTRFQNAGREIISSRYILIKIPQPEVGNWNVRVKGDPYDTVDITMVFNASLSVELNGGNQEHYAAYYPNRFTAIVTDSGEDNIPEESLQQMEATLVVADADTGKIKKYPMQYENGSFYYDLTFTRGGNYTVSALVKLGGFEVRSEALDIVTESRPLVPAVTGISDMMSIGQFRDDCWEVTLGELFGISGENDLHYTVSDNYNGALTIKNGILQARFRGEQSASFLLTAEDSSGQSAVVPFNFPIPSVEARVRGISDITAYGSFKEDCWEADLERLFADSKGTPLRYELSDDLDGMVTVEDGKLTVRFRSTEPQAFVLSATDIFQHTAEIPVELTLPLITTTVNQVTNMLKYGSISGDEWLSDLSTLFADPKGGNIEYSVSDDFDGALFIEDGILHMNIRTMKAAEFDVIATDTFGFATVLPFHVQVPGPAAQTGEIAETVKTGIFQNSVWERNLGDLFRDPKNGAMTYAISDDYAGAVSINGNSLTADCQGQKKMAFTVKATDDYDISAEIPVTLTEKNMTLVYALWVLLALAVIGLIVGIIVYIRLR